VRQHSHADPPRPVAASPRASRTDLVDSRPHSGQSRDEHNAPDLAVCQQLDQCSGPVSQPADRADNRRLRKHDHEAGGARGVLQHCVGYCAASAAVPERHQGSHEVRDTESAEEVFGGGAQVSAGQLR